MLTQHFAEGNFVTGIDIDQEALRQAKERLGIETHWLDINTEFPFESSQFDIVTACEVMEHIYDTRRFLENVFHCLKPGGLFLGSVPNSFRLRNRMRFLFGREYEDDPTHCHQFSPQRLREHLEELFEDVEIKHVGGSLFTFIHVSDTSPAYLNQLCAKDQLWKARKPC
jgi:2-polyprenyl-3-methyl-5-hydroxy-6-metoxy-1,4-benzoquinol methylase